MITNMLNIVSSVFGSQQPVKTPAVPKSTLENPFASPFINQQSKQSYEWKNTPIPGGYFAGYYNGQKNIVGRKLFVSV